MKFISKDIMNQWAKIDKMLSKMDLSSDLKFASNACLPARRAVNFKRPLFLSSGKMSWYGETILRCKMVDISCTIAALDLIGMKDVYCAYKAD